ncbi:Uncharacterised protein [Segatella copri]|nr:Uncharacterised protein [Segatella copri]
MQLSVGRIFYLNLIKHFVKELKAAFVFVIDELQVVFLAYLMAHDLPIDDCCHSE